MQILEWCDGFSAVRSSAHGDESRLKKSGSRYQKDEVE
jgi:hypothetical protein